jgi:hypothetical protein
MLKIRGSREGREVTDIPRLIVWPFCLTGGSKLFRSTILCTCSVQISFEQAEMQEISFVIHINETSSDFEP